MTRATPLEFAPQVIELRQYMLVPGERDHLIRLFEREFVEPQEALGLQVLASFTEPARPERFIWLRGFAGMAERQQGLQAFYGGPVWQGHRDEANATMIDSDDVLLLRPLNGWPLMPRASASHAWHALVCRIDGAADLALRVLLRSRPGCWLQTEPAENNFPRLPVRSGSFIVALADQAPALPAPLQARLIEPPVRMQLIPTARSRLS